MSAEVAAGKATFALRGHNPDVLSCIANLSNDEVFTPPELANRMLDTVAEAWSEAHDGASIWEDPSVTFLDPFTKSGVFLREITRRLTDGLAEQIPDLEERVDHILTRQVFGIGITQLTALLARRSVYCSKDARGEHSIATSFDRDWGNIWFERTEHTWAGPKCAYCGAQRDRFSRDDSLETHAYAFTHTKDIKSRLARMFGADVQFDVIIGNPPYQMTGASGGSSDASIYHLFVQQAQRLEPRFLTMIIPSRWMAGGRGMDEFRLEMLTSHRIRALVDYPISKDVFPGVEVKGGVCYFLWDISHNGSCTVRSIRSGEKTESERSLDEFDIFVRDSRAVGILHRVQAAREPSITSVLTRDTPFGLATNFTGTLKRSTISDLALHLTRTGKRSVEYVSADLVQKNRHLVSKWKVLAPEAGSDGGQRIPDVVLGKPWLAPPNSVCTQSFLCFYLDSEAEALSVASYYRTKFFRFLVSLRKITQHAIHSTYAWVPIQSWDRSWSDVELYEKYRLTQEEVDFIESQVKPMEIDNA
ncbi:MAG: Eco57I restriction-modification methylase domain-containing protein [Microbacteriaceae bacterium]|nr:Eco57I restriction-modification methylase domain-containing protein [Microbacteriaceae bacterium]